jgi:hypothetical protein
LIRNVRTNFDLSTYKYDVGTNTNIHKVSFFFKNYTRESLVGKKILFLDFEFSKEYNIYEMGGLILQDNKIIKTFFKEFTLPSGDNIFSFETKRHYPISNKFNKNRIKLNKKKLFNLVNSSDIIVCHNYVAEIKCLLALRYPDKEYNVNNCELIKQGKIVCTNYSFSNKYFKNHFNITEFSNSNISKKMGWLVELKSNKVSVKNKKLDIDFSVKAPKSFFSAENKNLHNSFFDSVVTLSNFLSLTGIHLKDS